MFQGLANPTKMKVDEEETDEDEDDESEPSLEGNESLSDDPSEGEGNGDLPEDPNEPFEDELRPREGYRTLDEEKTDIIIQLDSLKKRIPGLRQFTVHNDIRDMRAELERAKTEEGLRASLRWQRQILMAIVNTLEYANREWSPRKMQLDGWAESVHERISDYDDVFRELFFKYRNSIKMAPEVQLILMVGGSAMMFHFTSSLIKAPQVDPATIQAMMQTMQSMQAQSAPPQPGSTAPAPSLPHERDNGTHGTNGTNGTNGSNGSNATTTSSVRRQMSGPGVDLGALLGGLPPSLPVMPFPVPTRPHAPPHAPQHAPPHAPTHAPPHAPPYVPSPRPPPPPSERLSDILTEDLASVPDDLRSVDSGVREITLGNERPKKRAKNSGRGNVKSVVVI